MSRRAKAPSKLEQAYAHAVAMLSSRPDVTGVDLGPKYKGGKKLRTRVLRVHVAEKLKGKRLSRSERIPEKLFGVDTDVIAASYRRHDDAAPSPSLRFDPIQPGVSISNSKCNAGTLGLVVYDNETAAACVLSAFHVLAGAGAAEGDPITQPARGDFGDVGEDTIATLFRFFAPGLWGDAAIAKLGTQRKRDSKIVGSGVQLDQVGIATHNMLVEKSGRTTGVTRGRVEGVGTYFYPDLPTGVSGFRIVPLHDDPDEADLAAPGDSGAAYYTAGTTTGVGLHCAGGSDPQLGEVAIACSLSRVMLTLGVSLKPSKS